MNLSSLDNPSPSELKQAYRSLPRLQSIVIYCESDSLETLQECEKVGFIGLTIIKPTLTSHSYQIKAFKGKNGPCYDTAQYATYTGGALAVLDDDAHLLIRAPN